MAQFVGNLVTSLATAAGVSYGRRLGHLVQYLISVLVAILALGVLGLDTSLLVTAVTIFIGAFGLAIGLALGLGARGVVGHILAGYYLRQRLPAGRTLILGQVQGEVRSTGSVNTVVVGADSEFIIPNSLLLESTLQITPPTAPAPPPKA